MKRAIFITGPAGSGKTTLCEALQDYFLSQDVNAHYINLDPVSNILPNKKYALDIRQHCNLINTMRLYQLGPNGALLKCLESLAGESHLQEILDLYDDDLLLVDCPGQIEAYIHQEGSINKIIDLFEKHDYTVLIMFALDSTFSQNSNKFLLGSLVSLLAALHVGTSEGKFIIVSTKMDLSGGVENWESLQEDLFTEDANVNHVNGKILDILDRFGLFEMIPIDLTNPDSLGHLHGRIVSLLSIEDDDVNGNDAQTL